MSSALEAALEQGGTAVLCQVLSGAGGVGKTQVAARYARARWSGGGVDALVWLTAGSRDAIVAHYAAAAAALTSGPVPEDPEQAALVFLSWLAAAERRWLVVLDDLADPGDIRGLWPPAHPWGRVVVTTRRRDAVLTGAGRRRVDVEVFTEAEAVAYVSAKLASHGQQDDPGQARELARELGYLPIGLAQAVTYLVDARLDCAGYRARWADRRRSLARLVPQDGALPDDQRAGLAAVWSLSVQRANALEPVGLAGPALELAALLDPNGIPLSVLTSPPALEYLATHRVAPSGRATADVGVSVDSQDAGDALAALARLSLGALDSGNPHRAMRVHALVQRAARESLSPERHAQAARAAADALLAVWPRRERDGALARALRSNTENLAETARDALWEPDCHGVLFRAGNSLGYAGQMAEATAYFTRLHQQAAARFGPDHPHTLSARSDLAHWQGESGDYAGAVSVLEALLADRLRAFGPDHPDTLTVRHSLAHSQGSAGDHAGAVSAFEALLVDRLRVLGPDHPHTLTTRHNLARWQGVAGDYAGAASAFEALLADRLRVFSPDHPDTLTARHNLAFWRAEAGDFSSTVSALDELLTDYLRVLGPDHRYTLTARRHLARWRGQTGDPIDAVVALGELLTDYLRVLGPDHPDTLTTRHNLAYWQNIVACSSDES